MCSSCASGGCRRRRTLGEGRVAAGCSPFLMRGGCHRGLLERVRVRRVGRNPGNATRAGWWVASIRGLRLTFWMLLATTRVSPLANVLIALSRRAVASKTESQSSGFCQPSPPESRILRVSARRHRSPGCPLPPRSISYRTFSPSSSSIRSANFPTAARSSVGLSTSTPPRV